MLTYTHTKGHNLSRDGFWKQAETACPRVVARFREWIDRYGEEVSWDNLFLNHYPTCASITFYQLPIEMQYGILARFLDEQGGYALYGACQSDIHSWMDTIVETFNYLESRFIVKEQRSAHQQA